MSVSSVWIFDKESREDLRKALAESPRETVEKFINRDGLRSLLFTCEEYERRLADKDANIAQLIEQLQKAEAQNAALTKPLFKGFGAHAADCGCSRCENRTLGETK